MPRDATDTRARLLAEAERLFATGGVHQTTTRQIVEAAGQRNVSAVTYHFGSRDALLETILIGQGLPLDEQRAELIVGPLESTSTRDLVAALVIPYAGCLRSTSGRHYVRIVAQLTDRFPLWRMEAEVSPPHLRRILTALEGRTPDPDTVGRERVIGAIMLMTSMVAERARQIDERERVDTTEARFMSDLTDMIVGVLEVPMGPAVIGDVMVTQTPRRR
jgi:AcrR family transcriptional regulator